MSITRRKYKLIEGKYKMKDALTGKSLNMNDEVIKTKNAVDWVKKQGFIVNRPAFIKEIAMTLIFILTLILIISYASADTLTSSTDLANSKYPILTITSGVDTSKFTLLYNDDFCLTNCSAIINFVTTKDDVIPFNFSFYDSKSKLKELPNKIFYANSITTTLILNKHYSENCSYKYPNSSNYCLTYNDYNFTTNKVVYDWKLWDGKPVKHGNYTYMLNGNKDILDSLEWSFSYGNITANQIKTKWASWNSSITGLVAYWNFDSNSSNQITDVYTGTYNLSCSSAGCPINTTNSRINGSYQFTARTLTSPLPQIQLPANSPLLYNGNTITINCWAYKNTGGSYQSIFSANNTAGNTFFMWMSRASDGFSWEATTGGLKGGYSFTNGIWNMFTTSINNGAWYMYINGILQGNGTGTSWSVSNPTTLGLGDTNIGGNVFQGLLDDCSIWNRSLTQSEVTQLNGADFTFIPPEIQENATYFHEIVTPNNSVYIPLHNWTFSVDINNSNGSAILNLNGVNYTMINVTDDDNDKFMTSQPFNLNASNSYNATFITFSNSPPHRKNQTSVIFSILKEQLNFNIIITPNHSVSLGTQTTATGSNNDGKLCYVCYLFRNNFPVSNPDTQTLPVGSYNYTFNVTDLTNYNYSSFSDILTIGKVNPNLSIIGTGTFINGTQTNVTGINCPTELNCTLYRNGTIVNNPDIQNLTIGNYTYNYVTLGNDNYTFQNITTYLIIQINNNIIPSTSLFIWDFTSLTMVILFILFVVIAVLVLLFVHWELGCVFLLIEGFILILNLDNRLFGFMFIIVSIILAFMKGSGK